jgi:hypothetical protein
VQESVDTAELLGYVAHPGCQRRQPSAAPSDPPASV